MTARSYLSISIIFLLSISSAQSKELDRYGNPIRVEDFFGFMPPWSSAGPNCRFRKEPKEQQVYLDYKQLPIRAIEESFSLEASDKSVSLAPHYKLFSRLPGDTLVLLPSPAFHGWSFEPVPRPEAAVSHYLLDSNMIAAEFCRQNMNPHAAYAIYQKTAPLLSKNMFGIDYICDLYSELGKISELEPLIRTELDWLSQPELWSLPAEIENDSERKRDNYTYQKELSARLRGHLYSKMINGYLRISDYTLAYKFDRLAMQLDQRFPESDIFEDLAYMYLDIGEREIANKRIAEAFKIEFGDTALHTNSQSELSDFKKSTRTNQLVRRSSLRRHPR